MLPMLTTHGDWSTLTRASWPDTYATLHMWTQVVGKVCLALTPLVNHFWNVTSFSGAASTWRSRVFRDAGPPPDLTRIGSRAKPTRTKRSVTASGRVAAR